MRLQSILKTQITNINSQCKHVPVTFSIFSEAKLPSLSTLGERIICHKLCHKRLMKTNKQYIQLQTEMDNEDLVDDENTGHKCRLCFQSSDDSQMVDIFGFNESLNSSLADKIHDCLGLYISSGDAESRICLNCENTVIFIYEFQTLCRQTEKLYESAQIPFNNATEWQNYNDHISELRVLVRAQRDRNDKVLDGTGQEDSIVIGDAEIFSPEFIKVEEEDEYKQLIKYIPEEPISAVKNDVDPSETVRRIIENPDNPKSAAIESIDSVFLLKLKIAQELEAQSSDQPDLRAVSKQLNLEFHRTKHLWVTMKRYYRVYRKRSYVGHESSILRCRGCPLFTIMNVLVPKFDGDVPYEEPKNNCAKDNRRISIDLEVAIAEEIKAHPELWDLSLKSSAHSMEMIWREMTQKFNMDIHTLRKHWRRLRGFYRMYKIRELKGTQKHYRANKRYDYLLSLLHDILGGSMIIRLPVCSTEQTEKVVEQENDDSQLNQKEWQLALAREIQQYPIIWYYKHPDFHNIKMRDQTWEKIAFNLATDCKSVKQEWKQLKDMFRNRYLRLFNGQLQSDDPLVVEPLYEMLNGMFHENMKLGLKGGQITDEKNDESESDEVEDPDKKFDEETMLEFAKVCYDNDILWNTTDSDHNVQDKRNEVWHMIALQFGVSMEKIKQEWRSLRAVYRSRFVRSQNGLVRRSNRKFETPFHQLMKSMFEEHMQVGIHKNVAPKELHEDNIENDSFGTLEDRMKLLEEIAKHDVIWNKENPRYYKVALREPAFAEIAEKFGHSASDIKAEWRKFRRIHQNRQYRITQGRLAVGEVDPFHTLMDKLLAPKPKTTPTNEGRFPKRRFTGRQNFSDVGCIKIDDHGVVRYMKVCELCGKQVERSQFEYHMNLHYGLKPYACSFEGCDKQYSNKITRGRHEVVVHGKDGFKFQCDQCDLKFKQKAKFDYHYAVKHKSDEVPCDICGKILKHNVLLKTHMRLHAVNYECPVCGKVLQKKYTLNVHMRVHTKEKPYPCELCDQRFMLKVQMKTHLLKVHGVVLEELQAATAADKS